MTSKEIVEKTLMFDSPCRVARSFSDSDFIFCDHNVKTSLSGWAKKGDSYWEMTDEWGNVWARIDPSSKGEVKQSVLNSTDDIEGYVFPDFKDPTDYIHAKAMAATFPDKWSIGRMPGFAFNIARKLFKLENYLCLLILEQDKIKKLHDRIDMLLEDMIVNYANAGVDSIMFPEDWGTQNQTLVDPRLWYEEFYPRFKKLCDIAHDNNIKVFMHSCGAIGPIIPGLIKAGVDVLQFDQPVLHGLHTLSGYQQDAKITFWCPVDIQKTLQSKDERTIREGANALLDKLWRGKGGFIAGYYEDNLSIGLEMKWQGYACDEFIKKGVLIQT